MIVYYCFLVSCRIGEYISLDLFSFVNHTSSCALTPRIVNYVQTSVIYCQTPRIVTRCKVVLLVNSIECAISLTSACMRACGFGRACTCVCVLARTCACVRACVCVCVRAQCVYVCVCACVCVCVCVCVCWCKGWVVFFLLHSIGLMLFFSSVGDEDRC